MGTKTWPNESQYPNTEMVNVKIAQLIYTTGGISHLKMICLQRSHISLMGAFTVILASR